MKLLDLDYENIRISERKESAFEDHQELRTRRVWKALIALGLIMLLVALLLSAWVHLSPSQDASAVEDALLIERVARLNEIDIQRFSTEELRLRLSVTPNALGLASRLDDLPDARTIFSHLPEWTGHNEPTRIGGRAALEMVLLRLAELEDTHFADAIAWIELAADEGNSAIHLLGWYRTLGPASRALINSELRQDDLSLDDIRARDVLLSLSSEQRRALVHAVTDANAEAMSALSADELSSLLDIGRLYHDHRPGLPNAPFPCINDPMPANGNQHINVCYVIVSDLGQ